MFTETFPILTTPDLGRALSFYGDLLDGQVTYEFAGPDGEPGYVGLAIGSSHLASDATPMPPRRRVLDR